MSLAKSILNNSRKILSANAFEMISNFVLSFFTAKFLGPSIQGTWQTAKVILSYQDFLGFSIPFVMRRDYPQLTKEGKIQEANSLYNLVLSYYVLITPVASISLILYVTFFVSDLYFKKASYFISIFFFLNISASVAGMLLKGLNKYSLISKTIYIQGIGNFLIILFLKNYKLDAILWGFLVINLINALIFFSSVKIPFRFSFDLQKIVSLIKLSFPIFFQSVSWLLFSTIDKMTIAAMLSFEAVGFYSLTSLVGNPLNLVVRSFSNVLFTELNSNVGKDINKENILLHFYFPQKFFAVCIPILIIVGIELLPLVVNELLPKYKEGVLAAQIFAFSLPFLLLSSFTSNALFVLNMQKISSIHFFISGLINLVLSIVFIKLGLSISGVALATVAGYLYYHFALLISLYNHTSLTFNKVVLHLLQNIVFFILAATLFFVRKYYQLNFFIYIEVVFVAVLILLSIFYYNKIKKRYI